MCLFNQSVFFFDFSTCLSWPSSERALPRRHLLTRTQSRGRDPARERSIAEGPRDRSWDRDTDEDAVATITLHRLRQESLIPRAAAAAAAEEEVGAKSRLI